jgi:hypothetical protein
LPTLILSLHVPGPERGRFCAGYSRRALRNQQKNGRDVFAVSREYSGVSFMSAIVIEFPLKLWLSY